MSEPGQVYIEKENPHLGGYIVGGDSATYYPEMWKWLVEDAGIASVLDVGCGEGHALSYFASLGCKVLGIDGVEQPQSWIHQHDFTKGLFSPPKRTLFPFDMTWCCEFLEHVPSDSLPNVMAALQLAPLVLLTHADPGQAGYHHVNLQPGSYWQGAMAAIGYQLDFQLTSATRMWAGKNTDPWNHYVRSGMAFRRVGS